MILLLTSESGDLSHIEIVNWLEYFRADYMIITGESFLRGDVNFVYKDDIIICNGRNLTKEVSVVFYRRWLYPSNVVGKWGRFLRPFSSKRPEVERTSPSSRRAIPSLT